MATDWTALNKAYAPRSVPEPEQQTKRQVQPHEPIRGKIVSTSPYIYHGSVPVSTPDNRLNSSNIVRNPEAFGKAIIYRVLDCSSTCDILDILRPFIPTMLPAARRNSENYTVYAPMPRMWNQQTMWGRDNYYAIDMPVGYRVIMCFAIWNKEYHCFVIDPLNGDISLCPVKAPRGTKQNGDYGFYNGTVFDGFYTGGEQKEYFITEVLTFGGIDQTKTPIEARGVTMLYAAIELNTLNRKEAKCPFKSFGSAMFQPMKLASTNPELVVSGTTGTFFYRNLVHL
jgi:hypothetical protein